MADIGKSVGLNALLGKLGFARRGIRGTVPLMEVAIISHVLLAINNRADGEQSATDCNDR